MVSHKRKTALINEANHRTKMDFFITSIPSTARSDKTEAGREGGNCCCFEITEIIENNEIEASDSRTAYLLLGL
jgi:hypothetical protein